LDFRSKAEKKVREAGYDPARLPAGQYLTEKWPVLHAGSVAKYPACGLWESLRKTRRSLK